MSATATAVLATFVISLVLVPLLRPLAHGVGLVDVPDRRRKHHEAVVPLTGGLAIFLAGAAGCWLAGLHWSDYWSLWVGAGLLLALGLADDRLELHAGFRFAMQFGVAALVVYGQGLKVQILGEPLGAGFGPVGLGPLSGLFTMTCIVFMINAFNMADGLDGLAGGIALFVLILLAWAAWLGMASPALVVIALVIAAAVAGFLGHNLRRPGLHRARAFLGDSGSMMLGFAAAWLAVAIGTDPAASTPPIVLAWILIVPSMDTLALFFRRRRQGRSPFAPDRAHLHHLLCRFGLPVTTAVMLIHLMVLASGLFAIQAWQCGWPEWLLFLLAAAVLLGYQWAQARAGRLMRRLRRARKA